MPRKDFTANLRADPVATFVDPVEPEPAPAEAIPLPYGYQVKPLPKTQRVQLLVPAQVAADAKKQARKERISVNELYNRAVVHYLKSKGAIPD